MEETERSPLPAYPPTCLPASYYRLSPIAYRLIIPSAAERRIGRCDDRRGRDERADADGLDECGGGEAEQGIDHQGQVVVAGDVVVAPGAPGADADADVHRAEDE